jgi:hypothetical protein
MKRLILCIAAAFLLLLGLFLWVETVGDKADQYPSIHFKLAGPYASPR